MRVGVGVPRRVLSCTHCEHCRTQDSQHLSLKSQFIMPCVADADTPARLFWSIFLVANAETAVFCSVEGRIAIRLILDMILIWYADT